MTPPITESDRPGLVKEATSVAVAMSSIVSSEESVFWPMVPSVVVIAVSHNRALLGPKAPVLTMTMF